MSTGRQYDVVTEQTTGVSPGAILHRPYCQTITFLISFSFSILQYLFSLRNSVNQSGFLRVTNRFVS